MVDVIIPTYNALETLPQALDSLVAQTKKMFIVTVVQDCDDNDYTDIINEYKRRGLKIRLIKTPHNGGPGYARQYGMDKDTMCDYYMFLDTDDMLMPRAVERLYKEAKQNNCDILFSDFIAEKQYSPGYLMDSSTTPCTWTHGKIYKAKYLRDNNIRFLDDLRLNEDSYFNLVAHNCTKNKSYIKETTYIWRDNKSSLTRDESESSFFERSWDLYIKSQVEGILKIEEITKSVSPNLLGMTIINMYHHMMQAVYNNLSLDYASFYLNKLREDEKVQEAINTELFWRAINEKLRASTIVDKTLIFYKQRFPEWLNIYVLKEPRDERIYR